MVTTANPNVTACLNLARAIGGTRTVEEIYGAALDALEEGLASPARPSSCSTRDGVMRFMAHRGLSEAYRRAVEGHTPWQPDTRDPEPIVVSDVAKAPSLEPHLAAIRREGIGGMAFIPLVSGGRVIGKFMLDRGRTAGRLGGSRPVRQPGGGPGGVRRGADADRRPGPAP